MPTEIIQIRSQPGIKRDGTRFEGDNYVDGQWVRFQRGLPRKIGGYRQINNFVGGLVRQMSTQAQNNFVYLHLGYSDGLQQLTIDTLGNTSAPTDRTPDSYTGGENFTWQFDAIYDGAGSASSLIAVGTNTGIDISNSVAQQVYIGDYYDSGVLVNITDITASGGVCVLHPYLLVYGTNGYVQWSDANDPTNFTTGDSGTAYIDSSKVVKILPLRGGGQAPAGIAWTLDRLIRITYVGDPAIFSFDTITASTSILAVNSIIEYDGIFFWIGIDRFLMYSGVVQEVDNNMNINYFFDGLNVAYANKIFAYKVPRYGEIWWCYPRGNATECTHAIIFNLREKTWYDTELPNSGRSAGVYAQVFNSPLLTGLEPSGFEGAYKLWRHESGVDEIDGQSLNAVNSYFETADITALLSPQPTDTSLRIEMIEPDFVQSGDMQVRVTGRINARAPEISGPIKTFPAVANEPYQQMVYFKEQRREMRFRFSSNTVGGNYQMGQVLGHIARGDGRYQS
jgi:hypothetical protein